jgi:hypothetical protein
VILERLVYLGDPDVGRWRKGEEERRDGTLESHDNVPPSLVTGLTRAFFNVEPA